MLVRLCKAVLLLGLSLFAFLVTFNNITDYDSNFQFVRHVMSMDTTFEGNAAMGRAITNERAWHAAYWGLIAAEGATFLLLFAGGLRLLAARSAPAAEFHDAKGLAFAGATLGFLVWFVGFMAVGGEWFLMWQSEQWNGQQAAFRFYVSILLVMVLVMQRDDELPGLAGRV